MMPARIVAAAALLALASPAFAAGEDNLEGSAGEFKIIQLWSDSHERFLKEWEQPTPPHLTVSTTFERNQPATQFIVFANCTPDAAGNCLLSATVDITAPNGLPYGTRMAFPVWENHPAPERNVLSLAPKSIGLVIEDGEQLGTYAVDLAVTDENAQTRATSRVSLTFVEQGSADQGSGKDKAP